MKMKKRAIVAVMLVVVTLFTACGNSAPTMETPKGAVTIFNDALKKFDFETMSKCTVDDSFDPKSLEELNNSAPGILDFFKEYAAQITGEIKEEKIDGDKATVSVNYKYKDCAEVMKATITSLMSKAFEMYSKGEDVEDEATAKKLLKECHDAAKKDTKAKDASIELNVSLEKKDGKWYITELDEQFAAIITSNALVGIQALAQQ